jgi:hypothetical protein
MEGARSLGIDGTKPASDIADTIRNIGKLTTIAEREMHATVLSCARAPRQMLAAMPPSGRYRADEQSTENWIPDHLERHSTRSKAVLRARMISSHHR